jgi:hypothetical protein
MTPDEITHWVGKMEEFNMVLHHFPLPTAYRETTTFTQFGEVFRAKRLELGLTDEIYDELNKVARAGNKDVEWAFVEIGMTLDNRELVAPTYYMDLPLNYYWMDEFKPVIDAVEDYMEKQPRGVGVPDEELLAVVHKHLPKPKLHVVK